jgi:hypothetical protein
LANPLYADPAGLPPLLLTGERVLPVVDVRDVADLHLRAMTDPAGG